MNCFRARMVGVLFAAGVISIAGQFLRGQEKPAGESIFDFGRGSTGSGKSAKPPATKPADAPDKAAAKTPGDDPQVVASTIQIVADDFVADIYVNGKLLPADRRKLRGEIFGAQLEKVTVDLKPGDWVVFNVVNNRLRWNGAYYFAAAVVNAGGQTVFSSQSRTGDWSACDDLAGVPKFVADPNHLRDQRVKRIDDKRWGKGDKEIEKICPDFFGEPIWGNPTSRSTWIKFIVPAGK